MEKRVLFAGAVLGGLAVVLGAFGAHALRGALAPDRLEVFETAVRYQMYHALVLVSLASWGGRDDARRATRGIGGLFVLGTVLFSGSLYALVFSGVSAFGAVTPFGGLALVAAWSWLAWTALAAKSS